MTCCSRILVIVHGGCGRGGAEKTTLGWCRVAQVLGYRVLLITSNDFFDDAMDIEKVKCIERELDKQVVKALEKYTEINIKLHLIFVHAHIAVRCRSSFQYSSLDNIYIIISMRNDLVEIIYERNYKLLICMLYLFLCRKRLSYLTFNSLEATKFAGRIFNKKVRYVPNLIHVKPSKRRNFNNGMQRFLYIGRFERQKNLINLLKACNLLKNRGYQFKLSLVGEGSQEPDLRHFILENDLRENVEIAGYKSDIYPSLLAHDALILTSYYEGFPNVLLEALSQNTFLICTPFRSGARELITDDTIGFLTDRFDACSVADRMQNYIDEAPIQDATVVRSVLERYNTASLENAIRDLMESCG